MRQELDITVNMFTSTAGSTEPKDDQSNYSEDGRDNEFEEKAEDIAGVALLDSKQNTPTQNTVSPKNKNSDDISSENKSPAVLTPATTEGTISVSSSQKSQPSLSQNMTAEVEVEEEESLLKGTGAESLYAETFYSDLTDDTYRSVQNRGAETVDKDFVIDNTIMVSSSQVLDATMASRSKIKDGETECYDELDFEGEDSESVVTGNRRKDALSATVAQVEDITQSLPVELVEPVQISNPPEVVSMKTSSSSNDEEESRYHDEYFPDSFSEEDIGRDHQQRSGPLLDPFMKDTQDSTNDPPKHNNQLESDLNEVVHSGNERRGRHHSTEHEDYGDEDFDV